VRESSVRSQVISERILAQSASRVCSPRLVSFSGVDGAGKSTQIDALCATMRSAGLRFRVIRFWDEVARLSVFREAAALGIFKSGRGVGAPGAPVNRRDKNVRSRFMTCVRLCLYLVDAISLRLAIDEVSRSNCDVVLFDRYIYDELANLNLDNLIVRIYIRAIMAIVPKPHVSYFLDADPVQARARKPEYPLESLYINRAAYLSLSRILGGVTVIAPMPIDDVKREIIEHGVEFLIRKDREYAE
jgi:thymidylate kinase